MSTAHTCAVCHAPLPPHLVGDPYLRRRPPYLPRAPVLGVGAPATCSRAEHYTRALT